MKKEGKEICRRDSTENLSRCQAFAGRTNGSAARVRIPVAFRVNLRFVREWMNE
jgi:hypothetical protein